MTLFYLLDVSIDSPVHVEWTGVSLHTRRQCLAQPLGGGRSFHRIGEHQSAFSPVSRVVIEKDGNLSQE